MRQQLLLSHDFFIIIIFFYLNFFFIVHLPQCGGVIEEQRKVQKSKKQQEVQSLWSHIFLLIDWVRQPTKFSLLPLTSPLSSFDSSFFSPSFTSFLDGD